MHDQQSKRLRVDDGFRTMSNRMIRVRESGTAAVAKVAYDDLGRRTSLSRDGGVASTSYAY